MPTAIRPPALLPKDLECRWTAASYSTATGEVERRDQQPIQMALQHRMSEEHAREPEVGQPAIHVVGGYVSVALRVVRLLLHG